MPASGPDPSGLLDRCSRAAEPASVTGRSAWSAKLAHEHVARLEDVLAHDQLRPLGVPVAQRVGDLPVVVGGDPLLVGRVPDVRLVDQGQLDHPLHHPAQTLAVGRSVDRAVKEEVFLDELADVVVRDRVEAVAALAEQPDLVVRDLRGCEARCVALEQRAELVQVAKIVGIVGADDCAPIRFATIRPSACSISSASRTGVRLIPSSRASSSSFRRDPGSRRPSRMASWISSVAAALAFWTSCPPSSRVRATERDHTVCKAVLEAAVRRSGRAATFRRRRLRRGQWPRSSARKHPSRGDRRVLPGAVCRARRRETPP